MSLAKMKSFVENMIRGKDISDYSKLHLFLLSIQQVEGRGKARHVYNFTILKQQLLIYFKRTNLCMPWAFWPCVKWTSQI
jgi:hypothetical protein